MKRKEVEDFELECYNPTIGLTCIVFDCPQWGEEIDKGSPYGDWYTRCEKCGTKMWLDVKLFVEWIQP